MYAEATLQRGASISGIVMSPKIGTREKAIQRDPPLLYSVRNAENGSGTWDAPVIAPPLQ